jgi:peptidoglycan/LPS O-acetylase OafA/YrhL
MSTGHGNAPLRLTPAVRIAAVLAAGYGFALVALAIVLAMGWAFHRGNVGHLHSLAAYRGVAYFIVACIAGAALLVTGSVRAWRGARGLPALIPLGLIVAIGCVGEPIDILTGQSPASNITGALIICAAALPAVLLILPRKDTARRSASEKRGR